MNSSKTMDLCQEDLTILYDALTALNKCGADAEFYVTYVDSDVAALREKVWYLRNRSGNILDRANRIVNERAEEKLRMYGDFDESMQRTCRLFNLIRCRDLCVEDVYWLLIALKLAREGVSHREDNLLDACAYMGALNNHLEK